MPRRCLERGSERFEQLRHGFGGAAETGADGLQRRDAGAVAQCGDEAGLELAGVGQHDTGVTGPELQLVGGAPHEGEVRVDARCHAESLPESARAR